MKCILGAVSPTALFGTVGGFELVEVLLVIPAIAWLFSFKDKLLRRILTFGLVLIVVGSLELWWLSAHQAAQSTALAVQQLNGSNADAQRLREFTAANDFVSVVAGVVLVTAAWLCFRQYAQAGLEKVKQHRSKVTLLLVAACTLTFTGCMKPYDKPEFVEIDTSETGFLIPLEGDGSQQAKFQSEDYLKQRKVATKRVQITHRWSQEGRLYNDGRWIPTVRLVKVNRSPVTREWTTPQGPSPALSISRGTSTQDRAIWVESGDSVGFSMGFNCTAFIAEDDAAKFLYWYPSGSLSGVMDQEVRARIQQVAAEVAAKYPLDELRSRKQEIADGVKQDVTNFFTLRGVTVTTVGMFGGMTYENPEIQKAIDQTFIAQQLKVVAEAKFEAQKKENERIELEADGVAEKARREAMGIADAKKTAAGAEAEAIREVSKALLEAQQNPMLYQFKTLEVEKARVEKWDGKYPTYFMGTAGGNPNLLLQVPTPGTTHSTDSRRGEAGNGWIVHYPSRPPEQAIGQPNKASDGFLIFRGPDKSPKEGLNTGSKREVYLDSWAWERCDSAHCRVVSLQRDLIVQFFNGNQVVKHDWTERKHGNDPGGYPGGVHPLNLSKRLKQTSDKNYE